MYAIPRQKWPPAEMCTTCTVWQTSWQFEAEDVKLGKFDVWYKAEVSGNGRLRFRINDEMVGEFPFVETDNFQTVVGLASFKNKCPLVRFDFQIVSDEPDGVARIRSERILAWLDKEKEEQ